MTSAVGRAPVCLGLDFGGTGLRALFALPGQPARRLDAAVVDRSDWPWLLCEPAPAGVLPVSFPSLKSRVGGGRPVRAQGAPFEPERLVVRMLRLLRERLEAETSGTLAQTVISVPAAYRSAQRAALRDAAQEAGLAPTRLISDAMAAVVGHASERDSGTFLVYGMGYEGFELGLVRGVRGHYRALGHEGAATSGGRAFDGEVLSSAVRLLRRHRGPGSVSGVDPEVWLALRARAQEAREALSTPGSAGAAELSLDVGTGPPLDVRITRPHLDAYLALHVRRTVDRARSLLDQSGMTPADVDTLLLTGGNTLMEQIGSGVAELGGHRVQAPPELLALGALKHAVRLAGGAGGSAALEEGPLQPADPAEDTLSDAPALTATLVGGAEQAWEASPRRDVEQARLLAGQGRAQEAVTLLREIVAEAGALLDELTSMPPPAAPDTQTPPPADRIALRQLARAENLLELGRYEDAVQASHAAWMGAATRPAGADVLDAMIDVHCAAAMADTSPRHFPDAERWLRCAYGHDPTSERVRGLLAERTYRHAVEVQRLGGRDEAIEALGKCLTWNPEHADAEALLRRLNRDGHNRRGPRTGGSV
ncbi:Hsp70 family protein [Streptomyces sp. BA2]|uniref:Hsp70 family protein n=1 Tax=Streptomyces sp. BA2 TaxID=436595 RepID=UPI001320AC4A|nr:Hsp70 family protein [Streptomyces sp. BA2]MWA14316.1 Hsp70 family protein [Streptomyces sp. BA2]